MSENVSDQSAAEPRKFTLSSYDPVSITLPEPAVSDAEVDEQLYRFAQSRATYEKVEDRHVEPTDFVFVSLETTKDGEPFKGLTTEGQMIKLGSGHMPEGFEREIASMSAGETKTFDFEGPSFELDENGEPKNDTFTTTVTIREIRQQVIPAITDAWVAANIPGFNTVPEFANTVRTQMQADRATEVEHMKHFACASTLAKRLEGHIPDDLFEMGIAQTHQMFEMDLKRQGLTKEAFMQQRGLDEQRLNMELLMQAREMLAQGLALDALAEHLGLTLEDSDLDEVFGGNTPEETAAARKACEDAGQMPQAREAALRGKALKWLVETATIEYRKA